MNDMKSADFSDYYSRQRSWPELFDIKNGKNFLDIGCGKGRLGSFLKNKFDANVIGVELFPEYAAVAAKCLDDVLCGDIEKVDLSHHSRRFDYVVFSDSLEHLRDPESVILNVKSLLNSNGTLLLSIPNIRNFRVSLPLLLLGKFEYQDEGLLDRTHLRFFTRSSITNLLNRCGFSVESLKFDLPKNSKVGVLNIVTFGFFKEILTSHFFIKACIKKS